ncbi:MAG TPA: DUF1549 domain-containing protein [Planctomycetota bacterium]
MRGQPPRQARGDSARARILASLAIAFAALLCESPARSQQSAPHWAFVAPQKHVPAVANAGWCRDDIDRFVLAGLETAGLAPSPEADRALLLRRVSLVLTGLPPSPDEVATFVAATDADAYEQRVDALLRSEACAEHLATTWLDLARFADTYGFQSDFECRTWPWRDWLIRALHGDMPWDQFVREIVAGDLLPDATNSTRTATAFWRLHRQTNEGGSIDEEWRHEYIADRVDTFGTAFLGLTIGCARCHDHKSDPITQRDYYSLGSFFALDEAGLYPYSTGATPQPALRLTTPEQDAEIARLQRVVDAAKAALDEAAQKQAPPQAATTPQPIARFRFAATSNGKCRDERSERDARVPTECTPAEGRSGRAITCDGDARIVVPDLPAFTRDDSFSVRLVLWCPDHKQRAVVLHTSHYTEDADTQGYQLLLDDGRLCWAVVHHWPGSAIAVRTRQALPLQSWCDVVATYDGSSRSAGLALFLDGRRCEVETVVDNLAGPATVRQLELGARDRDKGFANGRLEEFALFDRALSQPEIAVLAGAEPEPQQVASPLASSSPEVAQASVALREARTALHRYVEAIPELMVMRQPANPPARFVLKRGAYDQPDRDKPVSPDVPAALLPSAPPSGAKGRDRLQLAYWLNDPRHPLASRVVVDRLWATCFGTGLVRTPENFGITGARPAQQPLLDALACDFASDRSVKRLLRRIVCSSTFKQSSAATPAQREADPYNERLARGPTFRLSAEVLRDQALAASRLLHRQLGGPSVKPWQPPGLWRDAGAGWGGADYQPDTGPNAHRRSLYTFRKRTAPPPNMVALDGTSREVCVARRQPIDTPLQALVLLGDPVFTECALALAKQALDLPDKGLDERLQFVFASLAARAPRKRELEALRALHATERDPLRALSLVASTVMASDAAVVLR